MPNERWTKKFGDCVGEDCEPYGVKIKNGDDLENARKGVVYTHPSPPLGLTPPYHHVGEDFVVVQEEQPSGALSWAMVHISRIIR